MQNRLYPIAEHETIRELISTASLFVKWDWAREGLSEIYLVSQSNYNSTVSRVSSLPSIFPINIKQREYTSGRFRSLMQNTYSRTGSHVSQVYAKRA